MPAQIKVGDLSSKDIGKVIDIGDGVGGVLLEIQHINNGSTTIWWESHHKRRINLRWFQVITISTESNWHTRKDDLKNINES